MRIFILAIILFSTASCRYDHLPEPANAVCDSANVNYHATVVSILQQRSYSCHSGAILSGGVDLSVYANVKFYSDEGSLWSVINSDGAYPPMPPNAIDRPDDCQKGKIKKWIREGAQNN